MFVYCTFKVFPLTSSGRIQQSTDNIIGELKDNNGDLVTEIYYFSLLNNILAHNSEQHY